MGKRNVFKLDLNESREGFCRRGRGRSFHVDGSKTEKARETNSGESGVRNLGAESPGFVTATGTPALWQQMLEKRHPSWLSGFQA